MDVDVRFGERDGQVEHAGRKLTDHDGMFVRFLQRCTCCSALDISAVDKKGLHGAVGTAGDRKSDITFDMNLPCGVVHRCQIAGKFPPVHRMDG